MKVENVIELLKDYDPTAEFNVIADCRVQEWSVCIGTSEGCTKDNCQEVSFVVESPNCQEQL